MIGTVIDGCYQVESELGEGHFGKVYRCRDLKLGRPVALKVVNPERAGERELRRFEGEARKLAALNHPNVVQAYWLGTWNGSPYIVMEFIQGTTLREALAEGRLPLADTLRAMRQVASGLRAIHALGIIHRDLSTNNIMITSSGTAKILDLGLAIDLGRITSMETQGVLVGTMAYISPELANGKSADARSEVFSFGVILYEALAGKHPFLAEHFPAMLYNIAHREADPLDASLDNCPPALADLVTRCLAKQPAERPTDMAEVERVLGEIIDRPEFGSTVRVSGDGAAVGPRKTPRNPYLSRVMIKRAEDFFGRRHEIKRVFARLNATPPGSVSLVGERRIGKSSLLNYVYLKPSRQEYLELPEKMVMVFLDLSQEKNMSMESFVRVMLGVTKNELRGRLAVPDCSYDLDGIKTLVQHLDSSGYRLALLLDEFDVVTTNPSFDLEFFSFLRHLANHYNVAYLTSSARDLQVLCHTKEISASPFFNIFSTMSITVFQRHEAEELVRVPSERSGRPLAAYTDQILEMAGHFPFFIQMACSHAFEYLEENPSIASPDFAEIRRRFYAEAKLHFRYIWDSFGAHEQSAVLRVAKQQPLPDTLQHVLQELETRHYIEPGARRPRLFAPTFEQFVKAESVPDDKGSLLARLFRRS